MFVCDEYDFQFESLLNRDAIVIGKTSLEKVCFNYTCVKQIFRIVTSDVSENDFIVTNLEKFLLFFNVHSC